MRISSAYCKYIIYTILIHILLSVVYPAAASMKLDRRKAFLADLSKSLTPNFNIICLFVRIIIKSHQ